MFLNFGSFKSQLETYFKGIIAIEICDLNSLLRITKTTNNFIQGIFNV